ncbi:MAG: Coenzyme F420 hydrogenase/dehydrogenase, beta subunit C-terminal domain [Bacteroidaceae bacterium]|nr:Coenzyme F420 hydrogenase/dehydrogenase, beta subunit C-terminal domain [Bacteroidaceae bacterium]
MIQLANRLDCTGCSACANICGHNAIAMVADEEGFLQPQIDKEQCVECGLCAKSCPIVSSKSEIPSDKEKQTAYALISYEDRTVSSSGGAFSVFAKWILRQGGIVYGATIDDQLQVYHVGIDKLEDLGKLRGSKYIQSKIGNTYREAKDWLRKGRKVLYTGTPCQIAGLYGFLNGKKYEGSLYTLDLVCHGVPSQKGFDAYLDKIKKNCPGTGNIEAFRFRKFDSWDYRPAIKFTESKWKILKYADNAYMNAFFEGLTFRESCFRCNYCNTDRVGTFTIADFWGIGKHGHKFKRNVACGVSLVIDNYGIMPQLVENLNQYAYIEKRWMDEAVAEQTNLKHPMPRNEMRDNTVKDMIDPTISLKDFSKKYGLPYQNTIKSVLKEGVKTLIYNLGLYNLYKTLSYKFS